MPFTICVILCRFGLGRKYLNIHNCYAKERFQGKIEGTFDGIFVMSLFFRVILLFDQLMTDASGRLFS